MHVSRRLLSIVCLSFCFSCLPSVFAQSVFTASKKAKAEDKQYAIQGEYAGEIAGEGKVGANIIALGGKKFKGVLYMGGLPGDGWAGGDAPSIDAEMEDDGTIEFEGGEGTGVYKDGEITLMAPGGSEVGVLKKVRRKSETLGMKPPKGAIVLFDGTNADEWENGEKKGKVLAFAPKSKGKSGTTSKQKFGSHKLHIEFRLPYKPESRGQGRGNSGLYLQGRYEVQMLDSFGLEGKDNECGGIYSISKPKLNMCYPPLTWQTYDVDFKAAEYADGKVVKNPMITVKHNGVVIHEDLELPKSTTASPMKPGPEDGPIYLQDHGNPVRYRNIWVVPAS